MTGLVTDIGLAALIAVLLALIWRTEKAYRGQYAKGLAWIKTGLILVGVSELVAVLAQLPGLTSQFDPTALSTVVSFKDVVGRLGGVALIIVGVRIWLPLIKKMGEARTSSEERYQYLVQNANMIILRWGRDGRVRFLNRFAEEFFGFPLREIQGKGVIGTIVPRRESSGRDLVEMIKDIERNPEKYRDNENENMRRDGQRVWISWRNKAIFDRYGNVSEILSLGIDVTERKRVQDAMRALASSSYQSPDEEDFLHKNLRNLAAAYGARYAYVGVFADKGKKAIRTLVVWTGEGFGENVVYELKHTPCETVCKQGSLLVPREVARRYPKDHLLRQMAVQSYFGATLKTASGEAIGVLCIMDTKPIELSVWTQPVLGLFAERISVELERQAAERELRLAARVFENSIGGIAIMDAGGRVLRVNKGFFLLTGYGAEELTGRCLHELHAAERGRTFYNRILSVIRRKGFWQGEVWERRKGGELFSAWLTISAVKDEGGAISHYIALFADITEKKATEEHIFRLAHYDALTGLPNRVLFQDRLRQALVQARRHDQHLALLYIDLDRFKPINDTLGHHVGDLVLKEVAGRLGAHVRDSDTVARMGGDEFTVILSGIPRGQDPIRSITLVAEKLIHDLARPYHIEGHEVVLTASVGIVSYPEDGERMEEMVRNADTAMYHAKDQGKNTLQFYESGMNRRAKERMRMELELRRAVKRNELELLFQPVMDLESGAFTAVEALVRWHHPRHGLLRPSRFIDIAEETGLIVALGDWVLRRACRQMRLWREAGLGLKRVAVNLSLRQLRAGGLAQSVEACLLDCGLQASELCLEITESTFMDDKDASIAVLRALRGLGVSLAIDDFGTGYSSLAHLRKLPIETLKIDKSFIQHLPEDSENAEIVAAIIAMAHRLNLHTIAEGVEHPQALEYLRGLHCNRVQGYLVHPPLSVEDCTRVLGSDGAGRRGARQGGPLPGIRYGGGPG